MPSLPAVAQALARLVRPTIKRSFSRFGKASRYARGLSFSRHHGASSNFLPPSEIQGGPQGRRGASLTRTSAKSGSPLRPGTPPGCGSRQCSPRTPRRGEAPRANSPHPRALFMGRPSPPEDHRPALSHEIPARSSFMSSFLVFAATKRGAPLKERSMAAITRLIALVLGLVLVGYPALQISTLNSTGRGPDYQAVVYGFLAIHC